MQPEFGRTILMPHGPASYHGHTKPLQAPDGRPRRSVAAYFYTSPLAGKQHGDESASVFMKTHRIDRVKALAPHDDAARASGCWRERSAGRA